jgi:hypothetical protein
MSFIPGDIHKFILLAAAQYPCLSQFASPLPTAGRLILKCFYKTRGTFSELPCRLVRFDLQPKREGFLAQLMNLWMSPS